MVQEKLNSLRPYVTGIRFVKNLPVVDLILQDNWDIFESDNVTYKISNTNTNYFMVFPKNPDDSIDVVLQHVEQVIEVNVEKEKKLTLLKAKIEELKSLFSNKPLSELEKLKFIIQDLTEPTMEDLNLKPKIENGNIKKNGVELPPPKSSKYSLEKEEN
jgi:hypothetical protein|tara:strand:+ start:240 stop:716 length:477 start_codon:yes stop_codon:yes gene_type:complete